jgi:hypothetical protein
MAMFCEPNLNKREKGELIDDSVIPPRPAEASGGGMCEWQGGGPQPLPTPYIMDRTKAKILYRNRRLFAPIGSKLRQPAVTLPRHAANPPFA